MRRARINGAQEHGAGHKVSGCVDPVMDRVWRDTDLQQERER